MSESLSTAGTLRHWQVRTFSSVWVTYFAFYLCRYNMTMAKTPLCETFSWDTGQFGMILSALLMMYAVGQFVNGQLADRFGGRLIASLGALGSVVINVVIFFVVMISADNGLSSKNVLITVAILWGINGFFQAMGWAPMVRIMVHWFPSKGRGKMMGFLGTCYQLGAAFSWFLAFFIIRQYAGEMGGDWRIVFLVPSVIFAVVGVLFYLLIRNAPEDVGLETIEPEDTSEAGFTGEAHRTIAKNVLRTLKNPYLWVVAGTFFLLDVNRYGFVNWLPAFLDDCEASIGMARFDVKTVMKRCIHPLAGSAGAIMAGWATDKFFGGRRAPVIAALLIVLGASSMIFPHIDPANTVMVIFILALIGFCTYGPHILMVGHAAQDFGKKSGAAGAAGLIDGMGYIGASLAGWGAGELIKRYGYEINFMIFGLAAFLGAVLICFIWTAGPKTYTVD